MKPLTTLVLATGNQGKIIELQEMLSGFPVRLKGLKDFGPLPEVVEDGETFEENAYKKASQTARVTGFPALADDSGLCVDALDGLPGVRSARYGGEGLSDAERTERLLVALADVENRKAGFECVISIAVPTGQALTYEGRCDGQIAHVPTGKGGFGYDPVFYIPLLNKTFAELTLEEKSRISHRGKALARLKYEFGQVLTWIEMHMPVNDKICWQGEK